MFTAPETEIAVSSDGPARDAPLPRRERKRFEPRREEASAELIARKLQELVAIRRFLHARDGRR